MVWMAGVVGMEARVGDGVDDLAGMVKLANDLSLLGMETGLAVTGTTQTPPFLKKFVFGSCHRHYPDPFLFQKKFFPNELDNS